MRSGKRRDRDWKNMAGTEEKREDNGRRERKKRTEQSRKPNTDYNCNLRCSETRK